MQVEQLKTATRARRATAAGRVAADMQRMQDTIVDLVDRLKVAQAERIKANLDANYYRRAAEALRRQLEEARS